MYALDTRWGRPKSGESLLSRLLNVPARLKDMRLVVQTTATPTIGPTLSKHRDRDKVNISVALEGVSEFIREVAQDFKVFAKAGKRPTSFKGLFE